jgi:hypothetical protein
MPAFFGEPAPAQGGVCRVGGKRKPRLMPCKYCEGCIEASTILYRRLSQNIRISAVQMSGPRSKGLYSE